VRSHSGCPASKADAERYRFDTSCIWLTLTPAVFMPLRGIFPALPCRSTSVTLTACFNKPVGVCVLYSAECIWGSAVYIAWRKGAASYACDCRICCSVRRAVCRVARNVISHGHVAMGLSCMRSVLGVLYNLEPSCALGYSALAQVACSMFLSQSSLGRAAFMTSCLHNSAAAMYM
jgi:hypothetical protein